ncbi:hypothetical protein K2Z83_28395 [Oscillochloris sp. ZM17-4]|uniref:hypothetical protein n=1 Tax=Oscillochloris sp. ZM17-4 TaxID=2866714 RepID=UPI001C72F904|nr:hypothetical protein [Oscillochloris sp. ZM17-4]MBX0331576.1 hypothetical protein [Oscillochloris sp. ZM17-4]
MARYHMIVLAGTLLALAGSTPMRAEPSATLLAPAIPEAARASQPRGVFFTATAERDLPGQVRLAGTPDGTGELCTDDEVDLRLQRDGGAAQVWRHSFATPDRRGIQCIPAQEIALDGGPGRYTVAITLTDRFADTFSSGSYYLLADPVVSAVETHATADNRPATGDNRPTTAPTAILPTATRTAPTATATPTSSAAVPLSPAPAPSASAVFWPLWAGAGGAGLLLLAVALLLGRRRRPAPRLRGIIDLADRETGETRTLLLHAYPHGVGIVRQPLDLVPLDKAGSGPPTVATIMPSAAGPVLAYQDPTEGAQHTPLRSGDQLRIQHTVELHFRHTR